jgi:HAE1 family hydrophobic/amphiphilic exporter-1
MQGPRLDELQRASNTLAERAREIPGLVDVDTSLRTGKPEVSVRLDRPKAADLGVQLSDAAEALRLLVGGDQVTTYNESGEQYEVHLRAEGQNRNSESAIGQLTVPSGRLGSVALENIASFARGEAPADIRRLNRQRQVTVAANMLPGTSQSTAQARMSEEAAKLGLGSEYRMGYTGRSRELNRTASAFLQALALSLIFMYLVLAAQFESWLHPVTILLSLPLTLPFALISIVIFGQSLNIFSALGMLVLFGVVKKNSILQIDHANQLREAGLDARAAIIQACRDRLRPILMTTLAFVAGMVPLVATSGVGSATNHAIGYVVIGGQTLVLALTLVVTPVTYSLFEDARERRFLARGLGWMRSKLPLQGSQGYAP